MLDAIETQVQRLSIKERVDCAVRDDQEELDMIRRTFGDLLSTSPSTLVGGLADAGEESTESKYWQCFAEVYRDEVEHQWSTNGKELSKAQRQQILADTLVWAEITQRHYDPATAKFVTGPHEGDVQFQRIGARFLRAKKRRHLD